MCTCFTHGIIAIAAGRAAYRRPMPIRFWLLAVACSAGPDLDAGLHAYGVAYEDLWGHRGMAHSLLFAFFVAAVVMVLAFRRSVRAWSARWWGMFAFFALVTASHGLLDMFTNGGLGIAVFSPFDTERYFMPWTPLPVPNFGLKLLFTEYMGSVLVAEMLYVALPSVVIGESVRWAQKRRSDGTTKRRSAELDAVGADATTQAD